MLKMAEHIRTPHFSKKGSIFEVDELWGFVGTKTNVVWITYALERITGKVVDFAVGRKTRANIRPLIHKLLLLYPERIFTDRLNIYPALIPKSIHKVFRYCTNKIERKNLTLRTHIKRLSRRTICFSRSKIHLEAHLRIYFWG
jgi:IS1 family transposase